MEAKRDDFVKTMEKKFSNYLKSDDEEIVGYAQSFVYGSQQYEIEKEAEKFSEEHPNATARDLFDFFDKTAPDGLAPGDDGADLMADDD